MSSKQQFAAKVRDLVRDAKALSPAVRKRVIELLEEARKKIVAEVASIDPRSFQATQLRTLTASIDRALNEFRQQLTATVTDAERAAFRMGDAQMAQPFEAAGIPTPSFSGVARSTLAIAQGYTADLISGLTSDAAAKLNAAIQRSFLGGQTMAQIIEKVGRAINGDKFDGLFSPIGERATTIATNEILRVHSIAGQARLEDLQQQVPGVKKKWLHIPASFKPRPTHEIASGQVRDVNKPFNVGGEELMYPRDPNGSPENTINCHCLLVPEISSDLLAPTNAQKQLLKDLGLSISVS